MNSIQYPIFGKTSFTRYAIVNSARLNHQLTFVLIQAKLHFLLSTISTAIELVTKIATHECVPRAT